MNRNSKTRYQLEALFHQASEDGAADRGDSPRPDQGDCHDEDAFDALSKQRPAVELIKGLADQIRELSDHRSKEDIKALADQLSAHADDLSEAIALNEGETEEEVEGEDEEGTEPV